MNRSILSLCTTLLFGTFCPMAALAANANATAPAADASLWSQNNAATPDNGNNAVANQKLAESKALAMKAGQLAKESAQTAAQSAATAVEGIKLKAEKTAENLKQSAQEVGQATKEAATQISEKANEAGEVTKTETLSLWERIKRAFGSKPTDKDTSASNTGNGSDT